MRWESFRHGHRPCVADVVEEEQEDEKKNTHSLVARQVQEALSVTTLCRVLVEVNNDFGKMNPREARGSSSPRAVARHPRARYSETKTHRHQPGSDGKAARIDGISCNRSEPTSLLPAPAVICRIRNGAWNTKPSR